MYRHSHDRRRLLGGFAAASLLPWHQLVFADTKRLPITPSDAEGPFYPVELPGDSDNDLLHVAGNSAVSPGQLAYVQGRVMDESGAVIDGARVEIWQCDNSGVYHHPGDKGKKDDRFQGFGAMVTNRDGEYHFRALRPVPYPGRTPHIHFIVKAAGFKRLTTQLYVAEEAERNRKDGLYNNHSTAEIMLVTSAFIPVNDQAGSPVAAEFNIVLG